MKKRNVLYIGNYSDGTTSKLRGEQIKQILEPNINYHVIDTHIPFYNTNTIIRSFGFRYKRGPLINAINSYILSCLNNLETDHFDLIWIDKAIFIKESLIKILRCNSKKLIHYTPDTAFLENNSKNFEKALPYFDYTITTKSIEMGYYKKFIPLENLIITTQGFSRYIHTPIVPFHNKEENIAFIGLAEKSRFKLSQQIIDSGLKLKIAGIGWNKFNKQNREKDNYKFSGTGLFGSEYTEFISSSLFSIGMLSKRFPEFHTTRTFEIPACGTALITERNNETQSFYKEDEAIFYSSPQEMIDKINYYLNHKSELEELTSKGYRRVQEYDNETILSKILNTIQI